jgi:hypothetical protein
MKRISFLVFGLVFNLAIGILTPSVAVANTAAQPAEAHYCEAPEYHEFDFWVGSWASYDNKGKFQGYNLVEKVEDGCAIQEWWRGDGAENGSGTSFSIYDKTRKVWNQTWVSIRGNLLPIEGNIIGKSMVLTGYHVNVQGGRELHRTVWTPNADGTVHQLWDFSVDGGKTWEVNYEGTLRRTHKVNAK